MTQVFKDAKVFFSYAWSSHEHTNFVEDLAKRLTHDGVHVTIDLWDLTPGQDKNHFMELCVKDPSIQKVLMIIDKNYAEKADSRQGGVGTESLIISKEVYENTDNTKFLPIVVESDEFNKPYLPVFLGSRIYINLGNPESFEDEYEKLIRLIYNAPLRSRPIIGSAPSYLQDDKTNTFRTSFFIKNAKHQLSKEKQAVNRLTVEFLDIYQEDLWNFELDSQSGSNIPLIKILEDKLHEFQTLKKDFIDYFSLTTSSEFDLDSEIIINFFEKFPEFLRPKDKTKYSWPPLDYEIFKIVFRELFIYIIGISMKNGNYNLAGELLNSIYSYNNPSNRGYGKEDKSFCGIISPPEYFDKKNPNSISPLGQYFVDNLYFLKIDEFVTADIICHIISFTVMKNKSYYDWYPYSNAIHGLVRSRIKFKFFEKLESKKFYDKVKPIFNNLSEHELGLLINENKRENPKRISFGIFNEIPFIHEFIPIETLASR